MNLQTNEFDITAETYEYGSDNVCSAHGYLVPVDGELENYMRREYFYGPFGMIKETLSYWNRERQNWSGGSTAKYAEPEYNVEKTYTFDEGGRLLLAQTTA